MEIILGLGIALPATAATGVSVVTGVAQGVSEQKKQNADASNQTRMLKFHLDVSTPSTPSHKLNNTSIVTLHGDKLWVEPKSSITRMPENVGHHPFTGFYVAYPDDNRPYTRGLVSTISVDPPMLNWIYVDKDTLELKYASRTGSIAHHVGSFDWTNETNDKQSSQRDRSAKRREHERVERVGGDCVTFDDWEGFVAVEESEGMWALYFDLEDDGLRAQRKKGRKVVEVSLGRRVISEQETNKWGLAGEGNIGFKKTREV